MGKTDTERELKILLAEYQLCQEKATTMGSNIWKTASVFTVGSVAAILGIAGNCAHKGGNMPWLLLLLGPFAIAVLLAWWRMARRWWSIEHAMFLRMRHIERQLQHLNANLYVKYLDHIKGKQRPGSSEVPPTLNLPDERREDFLEELAAIGRLDEYEHQGVQPIVKFVVVVNIAMWGMFSVISLVPCVQTMADWLNVIGLARLTTLVAVIVYVAFIIVYGVWQWRRP